MMMFLSSKPKVIFFDFGDTLIYFDGNWADVLPKSSKKLMNFLIKEGYPLDPEEFPHEFSKRMREYYLDRNKSFIEYTSAQTLVDYLSELGFSPPSDITLKKSMQTMYSVSQKDWHLEEDALKILDWLQKNNFRVGLISNASDAEDVYLLLNQFKLKEYFEEIIISAQFGWRKPDNKIFDYAAKLIGVEPKYCMMVGDRLDMDIHGAKMAGFQATWITRRSIHKNKLHQFEVKPDFQIGQFDELISLLETSLET